MAKRQGCFRRFLAERQGSFGSLQRVFAPLTLYSFLPGCWFLAKSKGRSGWWSLLGIFSCVGMFILYALLEVQEAREEAEAR